MRLFGMLLLIYHPVWGPCHSKANTHATDPVRSSAPMCASQSYISDVNTPHAPTLRRSHPGSHRCQRADALFLRRHLLALRLPWPKVWRVLRQRHYLSREGSHTQGRGTVSAAKAVEHTQGRGTVSAAKGSGPNQAHVSVGEIRDECIG